ncbi:hypothetical protein LT493_17185 [Streptomyces tricolor]|nr:hypothetical protein [Streptomyces tricolor]
MTLGDPRLPDSDEERFHAAPWSRSGTWTRPLPNRGGRRGDIERIPADCFTGGPP